jgi:hypothetical protein
MIAVKSVTRMRASSMLRQKKTGTGAMAIAAQLGKKAARREVMSANNERANLLAKMKELSGRMLTIHAELDEADQKTAANLATGTFFSLWYITQYFTNIMILLNDYYYSRRNGTS